MNAPAIPCEKRLETEQRFHAEAFSTVSRSLDQTLDRAVNAELALFRLKARCWFAKRSEAARPA